MVARWPWARRVQAVLWVPSASAASSRAQGGGNPQDAAGQLGCDHGVHQHQGDADFGVSGPDAQAGTEHPLPQPGDKAGTQTLVPRPRYPWPWW